MGPHMIRIRSTEVVISKTEHVHAQSNSLAELLSGHAIKGKRKRD